MSEIKWRCPVCDSAYKTEDYKYCGRCGTGLVDVNAPDACFEPMDIDDISAEDKCRVFNMYYREAMKEFERRENGGGAPTDDIKEQFYNNGVAILSLRKKAERKEMWATIHAFDEAAVPSDPQWRPMSMFSR